MVLIQINFGFPAHMMGDALSNGAKQLAESINNEEGFVSKVWIENTENEESGGIYLFEDMSSAEKYAQMHSKRVEAMGAQNITCKFFYVNEALSRINHGI